MAEQELNRSELPTPFKREEALKKGMVTRSQDFNTLVVVVSAAIALLVSGGVLVNVLLHTAIRLWSDSWTVDADSDALVRYLRHIVGICVNAMVPILGIVVLGAILANLVQSRPVFSSEPLKPDLARLSLATGFKRLFSLKTVTDLIRALIKFAVLGLLFYSAWHTYLQHIASDDGSGLQNSLQNALLRAKHYVVLMLAALAFFAIIDWVLVRRQYQRQLMMSRREIREEHRRREGDPKIKRRLRELRLELLRKTKALTAVKNADFVVTNPTHVAVAVKYDPKVIDAPVVVAKGAGPLAARIRLLAARHRVPVVRDPRLARALFLQVGVGQVADAEFYPAIARWLMTTRRQRRK